MLLKPQQSPLLFLGDLSSSVGDKVGFNLEATAQPVNLQPTSNFCDIPPHANIKSGNAYVILEYSHLLLDY